MIKMRCPFCDEITPNDEGNKQQYIRCHECKIVIRQW